MANLLYNCKGIFNTFILNKGSHKVSLMVIAFCQAGGVIETFTDGYLIEAFGS